MTRIQELASIIASNTSKIDHFLLSENKPTPSFDIDAPKNLDLSKELEHSRTLVLEATTELNELLLGPKELLLSNVPNHLVSLHAIYKYKIAEAFPVGSEATFTEISAKCGLNEPDVRRVLRHAMAHRIFREVRGGVVVHTAVSQILAEDVQMQAWTGVCVEEMWGSAAQTVPAMIKWPNSQEANHTGFALSNNTDCSIYEEISKYPARAERLGNGMSALITSEGYEPRHLIENVPWGSLSGGTVVDLGGAHGDTALAIAEANPSLKFIVQDLQPVIESRPKLAPELEDRITFMAHDFLTEQPVKNAAVYLFRWIFHNWSDKYCVLILRNLIPALKPNARIIINDACLPEPNTLGLLAERQIRTIDLSMLQIQNSREREIQDWMVLLKEADPRFRFLELSQPRGSKLAIIQAIWDP